MKTLYISDMDGTLLNNAGVISTRSVHILNELIEQGLLFSIATARSPMSAVTLLKDLNINLPVALINGVFLYDVKADKAVSFFEIPPQAFAKAVQIFSEQNKAPFLFLYGDDDKMSVQYTALQLDIHKAFYKERSKTMGFRFRKVESFCIPKRQHAVLLSLSDTHDALQPIYDRVVQIQDISASFYPDTYTEYWFLEVFSNKAGKAAGAKLAAQHAGADRIAAFGDNRNDLPLFSVADEKYAVGNAVAELKAHATKIIASNEENGVAEFLRSVFPQNP